jgi:aconitate decarboxylase
MTDLGATERLANFIVDARVDDLTPEMLGLGVEAVLDGIGNMLAGSQEEIGVRTRRYLQTVGGAEQATVIGGGGYRTNVINAAYANGVFGHALDYEPIGDPLHHPTSPVLSSALALAESRGLSGADLVHAVIIGIEIQGRLLELLPEERVISGQNLHPPGSVGPIGSAGACAKLLGLDVHQTTMALGLAASRSCGLMINTGTMTKSSHCGNASRAGLEAALLAEQGYTSSARALEGRQGYYDTLYRIVPDDDLLFAKFGAPFRVVEPGLWLKAYPAQGPTHWCIDSALELHRSGEFDPADIQSVVIEVGADCQSAIRPTSAQPATGLDGKFSAQYTTAVALLDGRVVIDSFTDERRFSPDVQRLLDITTVELRDDIKAMDFFHAQATVRVLDTNGDWHSRTTHRPRGFFGSRLPREDRLAKFMDCATRTITEDQAWSLAQHIETLAKAPDVSEVTVPCGAATPRAAADLRS